MVFIVSNPQRDENAKRKGWLFIILVLTDCFSHKLQKFYTLRTTFF